MFFPASLCLRGEMDLMDLNDKRVLVVGLGKSGVASALFLEGAWRAGYRLRHQERRRTAQRNSRAARSRHHGRDRRPRRPHLSRAGFDRSQPRRAGGRASAGAGAGSGRGRDRRDRTRGAVPARAHRRHHRIERQDYDHYAYGRNHDCRRLARRWWAATSGRPPSRWPSAPSRRLLSCSRFRAFNWKRFRLSVRKLRSC